MDNKNVLVTIAGLAGVGAAFYGFKNISKPWGSFVAIAGGVITGISFGYLIGKSKVDNDLIVSTKTLSM